MSPRTYEFVASLHASEGGAAVQAPPRDPLPVGAPPEFGGGDEAWSPEHLLLASVSSCFWTTYHALAARRGLPLKTLDCRAYATVAKGPQGLVLTEIRLEVDIDVSPADLERARVLVGEAEKRCLIAGSLRIPVLVAAVVESRQLTQALRALEDRPGA